MSGSTSIDQLPLSPQTDETVKLETMEINRKIDNPMAELQKQREADMQAQPAADGTDNPETRSKGINQLVKGIQDAAAAGALGLPSRDIPQTQGHLTQDAQIKANFIPQNDGDYIQDHQTSEEIIRRNAQRTQKEDSLDALYTQLQTPVTIGVLYFLFQLPVVRKTSLRFLPMLFHKDGNPNLSGYLANSLVFALIYYLAVRTMNYLSV
jgi:hypothetical protein